VAIQFGFVCFVSLQNLVSTKEHCLCVYVGYKYYKRLYCFATIDVMIYCQEYGIVTGFKQIVEVVRLSNQAIIKQITISRYRMRPLNTKLYIFSHYMISTIPTTFASTRTFPQVLPWFYFRKCTVRLLNTYYIFTAKHMFVQP
jgi:hypothetical protein